MSTFTNNNVASGDVVRASDHNTQGANIAAVVNGNIENDNIDDSAAIASSKLAGLNTTAFSAWQSWTPTFANFTGGSATVDGKYVQIGKTVFYKLSVTLSSSTMGTAPTFTLPVTSVTYTDGAVMGLGTINDVGITYRNCIALWASTTTAVMVGWNTDNNGAGFTSTTPHTWADGDIISFSGEYEAA